MRFVERGRNERGSTLCTATWRAIAMPLEFGH